MQAQCEQCRGSWQNPVSAGISMELAKTIVTATTKPVKIAIITPYRAQVSLLRQLLRAERNAVPNPYGGDEIEVGTVHQFQGSGAGVVIFDVVDGDGRGELGRLLSDDGGIRLVNVAITRARGKFVVIADRSWCSRIRISLQNRLLGGLVDGDRQTTTLSVQRHLPKFEIGFCRKRQI